MKIETLLCSDGSTTLFLPELDETYHSRHGAITESEYVYIEQGLKPLSGNTLHVVEFGLGTGLNALLSLRRAKISGQHLNYLTVEQFPLPESAIAELNYGFLLGMQKEFDRLHSLPWNDWTLWEEAHQLHKFHGDFIDVPASDGSIDLIYYDAFAPSKQAHVWAKPYLEKAFGLLKSEGVLVTYCAQGQFKRDLKSIGFHVEKLQGPPRKAEMVRAYKK